MKLKIVLPKPNLMNHCHLNLTKLGSMITIIFQILKKFKKITKNTPYILYL